MPYQSPVIRYVVFENAQDGFAFDGIAHDKVRNQDHSAGNARVQTGGTSATLDLGAPDFGMTDGAEVQFGVDVVLGAQGHRDNNNVWRYSTQKSVDGNFYAAVVRVSGGVQTPSIVANSARVHNP